MVLYSYFIFTDNVTCIARVFVPYHLVRFRATLYQCPETAAERTQMVVQVQARISDLQSVLHTTEEHSVTQLTEIAQELDTWQTKVRRGRKGYNRSVYHIAGNFLLGVIFVTESPKIKNEPPKITKK